MGHATTWSEDEDIILADSWIAISCDPIKSNQQGGETFWERIFALFSSKLMKKHGEHAASFRTVTAVQNRWSTMNHDFNKFAGCLAHVKAVQKSGYSEEDYENDALATYRSDGGKPFRFLRAFERVRNNPKWKAEGGLLRDKKSVKKAEAGKQQVKKARRELTEISANENEADEVVVDDEEEKIVTEPTRPIGIKAAKAAVKGEKKEAYSQLQVDKQLAEAQRGKAEAAQTQARTTRDEFLLKLIAFNPNAEEAKEWISLKISEAVAEARAQKLKQQKELQAVEEEMARSKEQKILKPARFLRTPKDEEIEVVVEPELTTVSTSISNDTASLLGKSKSFSSTTSTDLLTSMDEEVRIEKASCCAGKECIYFMEETGKFEDTDAECVKYCNSCKLWCHKYCAKSKGLFNVCFLCKETKNVEV